MAEPQWVPVASSNIDAVMYDEDSRTLSVRFRSGSVYSYADVDPQVADELVKAESPGRFFNQNIKGAYRQA